MERSLREKVIDLLKEKEMSVTEICKELDLDPERAKDVYGVIKTLPKILKRKGLQVVMLPPKCMNCGFEFENPKPSKCPKCRGERISEARFKIV